MKHPYKSSSTLEMFSFLVDLELRLVAFAFFSGLWIWEHYGTSYRAIYTMCLGDGDDPIMDTMN